MKKLIIVCEEKLRKYADFLAQLISLSDDKDGEIVGVKDGAVAAQVWTEEDYKRQSVQISSEQYLLFIGNSKLIKEKRSHMVQKFSKYGMNYVWLGKQGALFVDYIVSAKYYNNFIAFAEENQDDVKRLINVKADIIDKPEFVLDFTEKGVQFLKTPAKALQAAIVNTPIHMKNAADRFANNKKIEEQEYTCLILTFYMKGLSQFLGLSEE